MIMIMLCIEMCQSSWGTKKFGLAVPPNALRSNGPEWAASFDYIQSIKSSVTKGLIQVGNLAERSPLATAGGPLANMHSEPNWRNNGEPDVDCYTKTPNHRKILRKSQKNQSTEDLKNTKIRIQ